MSLPQQLLHAGTAPSQPGGLMQAAEVLRYSFDWLQQEGTEAKLHELGQLGTLKAMSALARALRHGQRIVASLNAAEGVQQAVGRSISDQLRAAEQQFGAEAAMIAASVQQADSEGQRLLDQRSAADLRAVALRAQLADAEQRAATLRTQAVNVEAELAALQAQVHTARLQAEELETNIPPPAEQEALRQSLAAVQEQVADARRKLAEHDARLKEKQDLERWERLKDEVGPLRQLVFALEQTLSQAGEEARELEGKLATAAEQKLAVDSELLAKLAVSVAEQLRATATCVKRIEGLDRELQASRARYHEADTVLARRYEALELYRQADAAVVRALPGGTEPQQLLDACQQLLEQVDAVLRKAMEANMRAKLPLPTAQPRRQA